jgi:N-methylhydantoinase A
MRFVVDTGGTFTDLVLEEDDGSHRLFKAETTPLDAVAGVLDSLQIAADAYGVSLSALLARGTMLIHGTTRAINAITTGATAKTALLVTAGHPDVLVLGEGGRNEVFNHATGCPDPYVPRSLTFEIPERIAPDGSVVTPLDEAAALHALAALKQKGVEAVAVCRLWSVVSPQHEERVGALLEKHLPDIPFTLSHRLNPSLREYRRASSAAIDASLKPLMGRYMCDLEERLRDAGFHRRTFVVTSQAGLIDAREGADAPIHLINSGPAMAPVAGRYFADQDTALDIAMVADTGGTTCDVSLVRRGRIPWTRETWIGAPYVGHMTGIPSVDVRSIGAGGGSIALVDSGGLLHVGPRSARAVPGPVCYGKGGIDPTLTDCALVLGYLDPSHFLGGAIQLDPVAVRGAVARKLAEPVATENMVQAIVEITVNQGIDPAEADRRRWRRRTQFGDDRQPPQLSGCDHSGAWCRAQRCGGTNVRPRPSLSRHAVCQHDGIRFRRSGGVLDARAERRQRAQAANGQPVDHTVRQRGRLLEDHLTAVALAGNRSIILDQIQSGGA